MSVSIEELLDDLTLDDLKLVVKPLGICKKIYRKLDLMKCIEEYLLQNCGEVINHLSEEEKLFVSELVHNGNCDPVTFAAKYNQECPFPQEWGWNREKSPLYLLVTDRRGNEYPRIPDELVVPLCALLPKPAGINIETIAEIPQILSIADIGEERPIHVYEGERIVI